MEKDSYYVRFNKTGLIKQLYIVVGGRLFRINKEGISERVDKWVREIVTTFSFLIYSLE